MNENLPGKKEEEMAFKVTAVNTLPNPINRYLKINTRIDLVPGSRVSLTPPSHTEIVAEWNVIQSVAPCPQKYQYAGDALLGHSGQRIYIYTIKLTTGSPRRMHGEIWNANTDPCTNMEDPVGTWEADEEGGGGGD